MFLTMHTFFLKDRIFKPFESQNVIFEFIKHVGLDACKRNFFEKNILKQKILTKNKINKINESFFFFLFIFKKISFTRVKPYMFGKLKNDILGFKGLENPILQKMSMHG